MEEKGETMKTLMLPEEVIHHIQSFMSGRGASRSAILSKSWRNAWLTRPTIDLDDKGNFIMGDFVKLATKTMKRYLDLNLKIERFRLRGYNFYWWRYTCGKLISNAIKAGATDVELKLRRRGSKPPPRLPRSFQLREVLASESLLRLCIDLSGFRFTEDYVIRCSRLKSLSLRHVRIRADRLDDIISTCYDSLEELSLSSLSLSSLSSCERSEKLFVLPKLRRLYLSSVGVPTRFFTGFASRFPCLKDLTILNTTVPSKLHIASSTLETVSFKPDTTSPSQAKFDVPSIRRFTYSGTGFPLLSIKGGSRAWEFDITIVCHYLYNEAWFLRLKKLLQKCSLSKIVSLNINLYDIRRSGLDEIDNGSDAGVEPLLVENMTIDAPPKVLFTLLLRLFRISRPKFITTIGCGWNGYGWLILRNRLMHIPISRNCGMPELYVFEKFGLEKVIYEEFDDMEKHLNSFKTLRNNRFKLIWD